MATKYVSSLTGPEMNSALIDMAYHNSEAYAVGTRNGVEVGSGDVAYHNNSKYYAEQAYGYTDRAEDAAARAEAAVPAGTAGAVFFDRAQSLTTAQQSQARANIMAGGTNRNLLDNAYFVGGGSQLGDGVFPINQRGQTSYSSSGTSIDRWKCWQASTVTLTAAGLTFATGARADGLFQYFPKGKFESLYGETVTASLLLTDGTLYTATGTASENCWISKSFSGGYFGYICNRTEANFRINLNANQSKSIKAVKLEVGTVSTLANDPVPDFGEELRKCQRYLRYVSLKRFPVFCDANYLIAMTTLEGIEMRAIPTPTLVSAGYIFNPATSARSVPTAVSMLAFEYNTATIQLSIPSPFNGFCIAVDSAICLSAEL